ncbi:cyclic nucleotide-binding domain-containing protein [Sinirhodobacter sp. WL0062]|uniref:Cyclic nucleotide-binding domain-containing protein n=1 Tax=Rhodobacter flavimaris TaxID=2907145 RepID=A0ABS8YYS5_9RHOB|nr:cyclic nucleotide-binding domain-containing protein [Sinirhodobacter sp. WL0062]
MKDALEWISELDYLDALGIVGVFGYVTAYLLLQLGLLKGDGYTFPVANLVSSLCILSSLSRDFNAFSASIEVSWCVISIIGICRIFVVRNLLRLTEDEARVVSILAPGLKIDRARRLLRTGRFREAQPGHNVAIDGTPIADLVLILGGRLQVKKSGVQVATLGAGALVGELSFISGGPATADVTVDIPSRLFELPIAEFRALLERNDDIAQAIRQSIGNDSARKLVETTSKLSQLVPPGV